ncbi:MAG: tetratricopeptide repeat protein, partial [Pseudomonadota bacterium]|nr:tetratricopeptide repeat protein [Pseudomonadota bacterium]
GEAWRRGEDTEAIASAWARNLLDSRQPRQALSVLNEVREIYPDSAVLANLAGQAAFRSGDRETALVTLKELADKDRANARSLTDMAIIYAGRDDFARAREVMDKALKAAPDTPQIVANAALIEAQTGDLAQAIALMTPLMSKTNLDARYRSNLAILHGLAGDMAAFDRWAKEVMTAPECDAMRAWLTAPAGKEQPHFYLGDGETVQLSPPEKHEDVPQPPRKPDSQNKH